jgi:uncharacterized protein (TIGR03067 family)
MQKLVAGIVCLTAAAAFATAGGEAGKIEGKWKATGAIARGKQVPQAEIDQAMVEVTFKAGKFAVTIGGKEVEAGTYKTDASKKPATIDMSISEGPDKGKVQVGIYKMEGDTLTFALSRGANQAAGKRPATFEGKGNEEVTVFKRAK